jgi:hypothetical protein
MSPEQASGDVVDGRSDLYSLGLVALFALTGRPPITGTSTQQILVKQLTEKLPPSGTLRADLPESLAAAIDRCVSKEPAARFETAEALVEAIDDARLAAPEIPVPIRLLAQELGTVGLIFLFLTIISWLILQSFSRLVGTTWAALPGVILGAIALTRALQTSAAARRLALVGFTPDEIMSGLRATMDEREALRRQLRADPDTRRRRRNTVLIAAAQLPVALLLISLSLNVDVSVGRQAKAGIIVTEAENPTRATLGTVLAAATGLSLLGVSFVLFARSPLRMPGDERMFRLVWLGPIGRAFVRFSARGVTARADGADTAGGRTRTAVPRGGGNAAVPTHPGPPAAVPPIAEAAPSDRMSSLEARIEALEHWRNGKVP